MLIGRKKEINLLHEIQNDDSSHFLAIYGRRRVGKTFLIREAFDYRFAFQHAGLSDSGMKGQIFAFVSSLKDAGYEVKKQPKNWLEAFEYLKDLIRKSSEKKKIIFIDELSWMDTPKCDLMVALENFWNGFASARKDIVLIVCASATSWMLSKVVHNKGGLYNRLTEQIHLRTFCLGECEEYVKNSGLAFNRNQILQYYMIFGGVPYYWGFLKKGLSLSQNIDRILFEKDAPLRDEFKYLYASVFKKPENYVKIIEALGTKKVGMTREEIINAAKISNSGDLTTKLEELESCGFIRKYYAFGMKKKNAIYQLMDCFTLFYFKFLKSQPTDEHFWTNQINTPLVNTWMGLAFERVCMEHIEQIKVKLGISGVLTEVNSWYCKADLDNGVFGSQIDMLIVRKDQVINLCEMKYSQSEYTITEKVDRNIRNKINDLITVSGTKYAIYPTIITTYGLVENSYSQEVQSVVTMDDLF
ncbi:ATP-binding protein [Clostridium sp. AM27-31LB]|jgi:AAA+ ATPase superfamily predicted ATPase|uniref:AAA family ATPase n=1 Tax=Clostridia TaxID=186801 RepID=UPI000E4B4D27|nr:ATP-binding protein [Clostridium sp. AM27-31LB]RHT92809.1 ATP-binding protein [Clostridium sp. AM27-31LB]